MNLTLVAFYGSKPEPLLRFLDSVQSVLHQELGPAFSAYPNEQVHATIIGLEGWRVGTKAFNNHAVQAFAETAAMDLRGLLEFIKEMPAFHIQIGGFVTSGIYPFTSRGLHPNIRSFSINGPLAVMMGWPVAGSSYPMTLDSLRRGCRRYNVIHKYQQKRGDIDNDFFLVLGHVNRSMLSEERSRYVQDLLRQRLAEQEPLDLILRPEDLTVVAYIDTQLPTASSIRYSLNDALSCVEELKLHYRENLSFMT